MKLYILAILVAATQGHKGAGNSSKDLKKEQCDSKFNTDVHRSFIRDFKLKAGKVSASKPATIVQRPAEKSCLTLICKNCKGSDDLTHFTTLLWDESWDNKCRKNSVKSKTGCECKLSYLEGKTCDDAADKIKKILKN